MTIKIYNNYNQKQISIFKGKLFTENHKKNRPTAIVFDLDETLGSYTDLNIIWEYLKYNISFNTLLDLFPEFSRYGIFSILDFTYQKKIKGQCDKLFIYTNNKCPYEFVELISKYFSYKLGITDGELFDQIIRSFKVNGKIIEVLRTTQNKTHDDFIRCTLIPPKTQICFIDNSYFNEMENKRVYYIQPMSYNHGIFKEEIINRLTNFANKPILDKLYDNLYSFPQDIFEKNKEYFETKKKMHKMVAQKIMYHIKDFFYLIRPKRKTKKILYLSSKYTQKVRSSNSSRNISVCH
jgi:hypothetical protein